MLCWFIRWYRIPMKHVLHPRFCDFKSQMTVFFILIRVEQLSWWHSRAIETTLWHEYLRASSEEKERKFEQWLVTEPLTVKSSSSTPSSTPSLKKGQKTRGQNRASYNFMRACVWRLVKSKAWYDHVMKMNGGVERLKQRHVVDVNRIIEQFNIAANGCPNSREKQTLCDQLVRLLPNAE
jgi:hypothetical protein